MEVMQGVMQGVMWVAADIPWGHVWLPAPPALWVTTFYAVLAISFFVPKKEKWLRRIRRGWIVIWIPMAYLVAINGTNVTKGHFGSNISGCWSRDVRGNTPAIQ